MYKHSYSEGIAEDGGNQDDVDCVVRPGGMLVQKRDEDDDGVGASVPMVNVKVSHGSSIHQITLPAQATFGDLKRLLVNGTGLDPKDQRLFFRGKEKGDDEYLHMVGVKDRSKLLLLEDATSKERKLKEAEMLQELSKACEAVNKVRVEVDKLAEKVSILESTMRKGTKVEDKEFAVLTELLMVQLLKLDGIKADGEAKARRRTEVRRVQSLVETLDSLKAGTANLHSDSGNTVSVSTKWEKFDTGFGSLNAPPPMPSSEGTQDWEAFD